jgi:hypothetical protein
MEKFSRISLLTLSIKRGGVQTSWRMGRMVRFIEQSKKISFAL